jgi:hypothetical protein
MTTPACRNEARRTAVRKSPKSAGFDYIEFDSVTKTLSVYFLGELPSTPLTPENFRIEGGRRIRNIKVVSVFAHPRHDPELDDFVEIVVDRVGDFSTYTLLAVTKTAASLGSPKWIPDPDFDPQYNQLDFSFTVDCPNELDCADEEVCPPPKWPPVAINYLAKDYATFRQLIFDRLAVTLPDWKNRFVPDVGVTLVELLAYAGDYLSYYQDAVATEAYLATARQRISVRRHARLVDYRLHEGCNARALVVVGTTDKQIIEPGKVRFITRPDGNLPVELTKDSIAKFATASYTVFEAVATTQLYAGQERIEIYTWGDSECCLPRGTTATTLVDQTPSVGGAAGSGLQLKAGDYLIFEEVLGPKTGLEADRDPSHRWAVRLTSVTGDTDPLNGTRVLHIEWGADDALPFPLCLSSIGPAPACALLTNVSVARGNVVLVDHGRTITEVLPAVEEAVSTPTCDGEGQPSEVTHRTLRFRPSLSQPGLTYRQGPLSTTPASIVFTQDPHSSVPVVTLSNSWTPSLDLIDKRETDRNFVVEIDNDRVAWLRFGDGCHGALPSPGVAFQAVYRVGNGKAGNVGAESIQHVLWDTQVTDLIVSVRNPLPARGGVDPQPIEEAKLFAPHTFRTQIERAITADDYAAIAQREFPLEVQRAACQLRWNGSWYEALVAIDAFGTEQASDDLLERVEHRLRWFRRVGHDLRIEAASRVPIYISLLVCVKAVYLRAHVLADLEARFGTGMLPDGRLGFFHPDNLTFSEGLYLSRIVSLAQSVAGVESVQAKRFEREFDSTSSGIASGVIPLGPFELAVCDSDPSFPENGRIEFLMGGGR